MFSEYKWATSIPEVCSFVLAAVWMVRFASGKGTARYSHLLAAYGFVVILGLAQIAVGITIYRRETWLYIIYWLGNLAILFSAIQTFSDVSLRDTFLRRLAIFGFVVAVVGSLQAITTDAVVYWMFTTKAKGWVVVGPFLSHNQYAAFVELLLPVALYTALTDRVWRWFYLVIAATMYASIFIAGSRAGAIITSLELVVVMGVTARSNRLSVKGFWGAAGLLAGMVVLLSISAGPDYMAKRFEIKDPYSIRREFLYSSLEMFRQKPITGFGLGNWATAYPRYASFDDGLYANQAHNDWIQWAVEGGAPLLLVMLAVAVGTAPRAIRSGWGCGVTAVFMHCLVDYPIQRPAVAVIFFSLMAALPAGDTNQRKGKPV
jgi:O-antigen ligase